MSADNIDVLRRGYDAFNRGDGQTVLSLMTDDIEFVAAESSAYYRGSSYIGKQEIAKFLAQVAAEWSGNWFDVEQFHDAGDVAVMQGRYRGTYKATNRTVAAQTVHIWTLRAGKLAKLQQYEDTAALRDVMSSPAS